MYNTKKNYKPGIQQFNENGSLVVEKYSGNGVNTDISSTVWGVDKVSLDYSLFHGLFTYNIPEQLWLTFEDGIETINSTRVISEDGEGVIKSGTNIGDTGFLRSKRHPRYQPNRGHLFATAGFLPLPEANGIRKIGLINTVSGVYFQLENGILYAVILDKGIEKVKEEIDLSKIELGVSDLSKGTLYDIQFQWRGVGDYFFYINQKLVHKTEFLGNNTEITIANPAISAGLYSENIDGTEVEIKLGCVDISSEGGKREGANYVSIANDTTKAVSTANYPAIIAHIKQTLNGTPNTRDALALRVTGSSDQRSYMKAYVTRDGSAITGATYVEAQPGSGIEFDKIATALDINKCRLLWSRRVNIDESGQVELPSDLIDFYLTEGDYLIITMEREAPTQTANVVVSLEMGEEI